MNSLVLDNPDMFILNPLSILKTYKDVTNEDMLSYSGDFYESYKALSNILDCDSSLSVNIDIIKPVPLNYNRVLNNFQSDSGDNIRLNNYSNNLILYISVDKGTNNTRLTNPVTLRSTGKNPIVTYNAMQKVFKSRFGEGRSNTRMEDVSNLFNPYLFLNESKIKYEHLLSKDTNNFINVVSFNNKIKDTFTNLYEVNSLLNTYFTDLPFLQSNISALVRYLWYDWDSR